MGHREKAMNSSSKVVFDKDSIIGADVKTGIFPKIRVTPCYPNFQTYTIESMSLLLSIPATFQIKIIETVLFAIIQGGEFRVSQWS